MASQRILLCLGDALFVESLRDYIEYRCDGTIVAATANSAEALWLAQQSQPDIAVVEVGKWRDGMSVLAALKQHLPHVKILMLSASEDRQIELQANALGADAFIYTLAGLAAITDTINQLGTASATGLLGN
jgi:two-component system, NarL family, nitrate/nitrite response regulator NarL